MESMDEDASVPQAPEGAAQSPAHQRRRTGDASAAAFAGPVSILSTLGTATVCESLTQCLTLRDVYKVAAATSQSRSWLKVGRLGQRRASAEDRGGGGSAEQSNGKPLKVHIRGLGEFVAYFASLEENEEWTRARLAPLSVILDYHDELHGPIPPRMTAITTIEWLDLGRSNLTGEIPSSIGALVCLRKLYLAGNKLTGQLPASLGNLSHLWELSLAGNELSGNIPASFGNFSSLTYMSLRDNKLSGPIPEELGELRSLKELWLNANYLEGPVPASLGRLESLEGLYLNNNQLSELLPESLGNLSKLEMFSLRHNRITGPPPESLGRLTNLKSLYLDKNDFTGRVPGSFSQLTNLVELNMLGNKQLEGKAEARNMLSLALPNCVCYI